MSPHADPPQLEMMCPPHPTHVQSATKKTSIYNSTKLYMKVNCMVHPIIFVPHCECLYLLLKSQSRERETKGISLFVSTAHPLSLHHFHVRTQTISRPSKSMPLTHSRVTVTVFQVKALYGHWTSEYAHYGHRIHSCGDHTVPSSPYVSVFC
jgi:hypothetical protein